MKRSTPWRLLRHRFVAVPLAIGVAVAAWNL